MIPTPFNVGAFVPGAPTSPRAIVRHADLLTAYADGAMAVKGAEREAYLSHFVYGTQMEAHYRLNRASVAGYAGPCGCRWLVFDIDRENLVIVLADARKLVGALARRYPESDGGPPVYFSGGKGFHVLPELAHGPRPTVGFQHVCRTLAEALAAVAGVKIDPAIYDVNRVVLLPNTKHPRNGLFKRRIDADALFRLDIDDIRAHAQHAAGDGLLSARKPSEQLASSICDAALQELRLPAEDHHGC